MTRKSRPSNCRHYPNPMNKPELFGFTSALRAIHHSRSMRWSRSRRSSAGSFVRMKPDTGRLHVDSVESSIDVQGDLRPCRQIASRSPDRPRGGCRRGGDARPDNPGLAPGPCSRTGRRGPDRAAASASSTVVLRCASLRHGDRLRTPSTSSIASRMVVAMKVVSSGVMMRGGAMAMPSLEQRTIRPRARVAAWSLPPMFRAGSNLALVPLSATISTMVMQALAADVADVGVVVERAELVEEVGAAGAGVLRRALRPR